MRKLLSAFGVVGLACLFLISPLDSFASTSSHESESLSSSDKEIEEYSVRFTGLTVAPPTYFYDIGGWSGTLSLVKSRSTGTEIIGYYSGTVHCSGVCSTSEGSNE